MTHWQPAEVVLPSSGISQATLDFTRQFSSYKSSYGDCVRTEFVSGPYTDCSASLQLLSEAYASDAEIIEIINHLPPVIVCCLAMTYRYLQDFKMDRLLQNIRYTHIPFFTKIYRFNLTNTQEHENVFGEPKLLANGWKHN